MAEQQLGSRVPSADEQEELDLSAIAPQKETVVAGSLVLGVGVLNILLGIQTQSVWRMEGLALAATVLMFVFGVSALVLGWHLRRSRGWAARSASLLTAACALSMGAWSLYALLHGFVSLLSIALVPTGVFASRSAWQRIVQTRAADEARSRLVARGFDGGF